MDYLWPEGYSGIGADIKWCGRHSGGKHCLLCKHHAKFEKWSNEWHWYYLTSWYEDRLKYWVVHANYKYHWRYTQKYPIKPDRYKTTGLTESELRAILRRGCRKNRKCKCINVVQRGNWYCPNCYQMIDIMAKNRGCNVHSVMMEDRNELKSEVLIMLLSGTV